MTPASHPFNARAALPDLVAGISVAGLVLPEAIAYSGLAGRPAISGIVAACLSLLIFAAIGSSRVALVAATSSSAIVLAAAVHLAGVGLHLPDAQISAALIVTTGCIFMLGGALRLGRAAHFIARPVVRGLAFGLALVIVLRQVANTTGASIAQDNFFIAVWVIAKDIAHWNWPAVACGVCAWMLLMLLGRWPRIPGPLLIIVLGIVAQQILLRYGIDLPTVGTIDLAQLHPAIPSLSGNQWLRIMELSVALTLILFAESYGSIRALALKRNEGVNVNRDLFALGVANLTCGIFQSMPVGAGYSATTANDALGARTRLAGLIAGVVVAVGAFSFLRFVALIPHAVLAAIIIYAMRHALGLTPLRYYFVRRRDRLMVAVSVIAVLVMGVLDGLLASIAFSLIMLVRGFAQPRLTQLGQLDGGHDYVSVTTHPQATHIPHTLILRPEEPLFFANVSDVLEHARDELLRDKSIRTLILSLEESPDLDGTAVEALEQFAQGITTDGYRLVLARLKDPVARVLHRATLPGTQLTTESVAAAVALCS